MDQIEFPKSNIWKVRQEWFENQLDVEHRGGGYVLGEHATGLLVDLEAIFCVGAFVSTVILACTIVDAHLREAELEPKFGGGIQAAFQTSDFRTELDWLRTRRNQLVHYKANRPLAVSVEQQWTDRKAHEVDGRRAIEVVANVLFENPFV